MGKLSRDKGARFERELVNDFKDRGLAAQRVPLSGATEYAKGDVEVTANFAGNQLFRGECKRRAALPKFLTENLEGNDFLALREDRGKTLIVLPLDTFMDLLQ